MAISAQDLLDQAQCDISRNQVPSGDEGVASHGVANTKDNGDARCFTVVMDDLTLALGGRGLQAWLAPRWGPVHTCWRLPGHSLQKKTR